MGWNQINFNILIVYRLRVEFTSQREHWHHIHWFDRYRSL